MTKKIVWSLSMPDKIVYIENHSYGTENEYVIIDGETHFVIANGFDNIYDAYDHAYDNNWRVV